MGTREVYEEKLRSGNLYHQPTINPGLGSARCPRCFSLVNPESEAGDWTITTVLHDATAVAGSGAGGMLSAIHGLNHGMPYIRNRVKGPMWLHLILGLPPILLYSAAGAVLGGYALPRFAQCSVTSYYAASSASHYAISQFTRRVEGVGSGTQHEKPTCNYVGRLSLQSWREGMRVSIATVATCLLSLAFLLTGLAIVKLN